MRRRTWASRADPTPDRRRWPRFESRIGSASRHTAGEADQAGPRRAGWIVLKALEKDRNRRYETAKGLSPPMSSATGRRACRRVRHRRFYASASSPGEPRPPFGWRDGACSFWSCRQRAVGATGPRSTGQKIALESARKIALTEQGIREALRQRKRNRAGCTIILKGRRRAAVAQPARRWELLIKTARGTRAGPLISGRAEGSSMRMDQAMDKLEQKQRPGRFDLAQRRRKIHLDTTVRALRSPQGGRRYRRLCRLRTEAMIEPRWCPARLLTDQGTSSCRSGRTGHGLLLSKINRFAGAAPGAWCGKRHPIPSGEIGCGSSRSARQGNPRKLVHKRNRRMCPSSFAH